MIFDFICHIFRTGGSLFSPLNRYVFFIIPSFQLLLSTCKMSREARKLVFQTGLTQTDMYRSQKQARSLKFSDFKKRNRTIRVAKTKALISFAVTAKRRCFRIGKYPVFSRCGSYENGGFHSIFHSTVGRYMFA